MTQLWIARLARAHAPTDRGAIPPGEHTGPDEGSFFGWPLLALPYALVTHLAAADAPATLRLRYRLRGGRVWLGTNAFFFEEGGAERFSAARYGEFRVDRRSGAAALVGLRDARLDPL